MKVLGQTHSQSGKIVANQLTSKGMYLGSKMSSHQNKTHAQPSQTERVHRSDLERGHHIPKDGQMSMTHRAGAQRAPWQRKRNH